MYTNYPGMSHHFLGIGEPRCFDVEDKYHKQRELAMVIPLTRNPEGIGIGEWVIFFSENFEGMGMGNSKKLCA